jgi:hypothetical protein
MLTRVLILIASFMITQAAAAVTVDCDSKPTFLRQIPGGHEVVFYCGCEPPPPPGSNADGKACGMPSDGPSDSGRLTSNVGALPYVERIEQPDRGVRDAAPRTTTFAPTMRGLGAGPAHTQPCVGLCYGVASPLTGRSRNAYVRGHFRSNGTYVAQYTRSTRRTTSGSGRRR